MRPQQGRLSHTQSPYVIVDQRTMRTAWFLWAVQRSLWQQVQTPMITVSSKDWDDERGGYLKMPSVFSNRRILTPANLQLLGCWLTCHCCDLELIVAKGAGIEPRIRGMPERDGIWGIRYSCNLFGGHNSSIRGPSDVADLMIWEGKAPDSLQRTLRCGYYF